MIEPSEALITAWKIAAAEAGILQHPCIERVHVLIGVCSLEKVWSQDVARPGQFEVVELGDYVLALKTPRIPMNDGMRGVTDASGWAIRTDAEEL
jgi:hypothetical protein